MCCYGYSHNDYNTCVFLWKASFKNARSDFKTCSKGTNWREQKRPFMAPRPTKSNLGNCRLHSRWRVVVYNDVGIANIINNNLSSVVTKDRLSIQKPLQIFNSSYDDRLTHVSFKQEDVCKLRKNLKPCKALEPSNIYLRVLKESASKIAEPLYNICKESLRQCVII